MLTQIIDTPTPKQPKNVTPINSRMEDILFRMYVKQAFLLAEDETRLGLDRPTGSRKH